MSVSEKLGQAFIDNFNQKVDDPDLYTDDATMWNNLTQDERPAGAGHGMGRKMQDVLPDLRFETVSVNGWEAGFAVEYVIKATLPDGAQLHAPACGIGIVRDGRIARFAEYVDSGHVAGLAAAVAHLLAEQPS
jgi:ketosteroid isomerase-like protein